MKTKPTTASFAAATAKVELILAQEGVLNTKSVAAAIVRAVSKEIEFNDNTSRGQQGRNPVLPD